MQPALNKGQIPTRDTIAKPGAMWPIVWVGNLGMMKSHTCVKRTVLPSGRLMVMGLLAMRLFSTLTPSITNIDVAPVSVMASCVAIVIKFNVSCEGAQKMWLAAAANGWGRCKVTCNSRSRIQGWSLCLTARTLHINWVGYVENSVAETKCLNVYALSPAPPRRKRRPCWGSKVLESPWYTFGGRD